MKILIAEDENSTRLMLRRTLERWGHEVVEAANGVEAFALFQQAPVPMVITDWMMPEMDGLELVKNIRAIESNEYVYIIMLTGKSDKSDMISGMAAGADDFVTKPFNRDELRVRLRAGERIVQLTYDLNLHNEEVEQVNKELERVNKRMRNDLEAAAVIQKSLLPSAPPENRTVNVAWKYLPSDELAGDILNAFNLDENEIGFYVLDVSGHGVAAALLAVSLSRLLSATMDQSSLLKSRHDSAEGYRITPPPEVAYQLNQRFQLNPETGQYFTMIYGLLNKQTYEMRYVSAGHPGMLYISRAGEGRILEVPSLPIGFAENIHYEEQVVQLHPGDRVYLYSDGIPEAANREGEMFGNQNMVDSALDSHEMPLSKSTEKMIGKLTNWCRSEHFKDDVSILAIEIDPSAGQQT